MIAMLRFTDAQEELFLDYVQKTESSFVCPEQVYNPALRPGLRLAGEVSDKVKGLITLRTLMKRKNVQSHRLSRKGKVALVAQITRRINYGAIIQALETDIRAHILEQYPELSGHEFLIDEDWTVVRVPDTRPNIP